MSVGKLKEFDMTEGNWRAYSDRLEMYFLANAVKNELKLPILIASMGDAAYELLSNLASPKKPSELEYEYAVQIMLNHLEPKPSLLAERYRFRQRRQEAGEKLQEYIAGLKKLSRFCEFGPNLNENLRDQFICGIRSEFIRQQLFANQDVTWSKSVTLATALEGAERDAAAVEPAIASGKLAGGAYAAPSTAAFRQSETINSVRGGCLSCGGYGHRAVDCKFRTYECSKCGKVGHLRRMCPQNGAAMSTGMRGGSVRGRGRGSGQSRGGPNFSRGNGRGAYNKWQSVNAWQRREDAQTNWLDKDKNEEDEVDETDQFCYNMSLSHYKPVRILMNVNSVILPMEIDTGSPLSCINYDTYAKYFRACPLLETNLSVNFYNMCKDNALGRLEVEVCHLNNKKKLDLYVFRQGATSLLGRQWLAELQMEIPMLSLNNLAVPGELNKEQKNKLVNDLISRHEKLFDGTLGYFTGGRATLRLREGATPVFCRARPLPYSLRERVDGELDAMLSAGVIEPVDCSDWATPLVIVYKPDGSLRLCADYKVTLNKVLHVDKFPIPKIDDLLSKLGGSKFFTKLDLSQAYNQILLDDTRDLTVINTHKGLFKYNRLVFGLSSSPGIFQRIMSQLFDKVPDVTVFLDDILISTSTTLDDHLKTVNRVMQILEEKGLKIKKSKCEFFADQVKYLGFVISREGVKVDPEKVRPILEITPPGSVPELRSFIGMVNFYGKFVKNLSPKLAPLYSLLRKGKHWFWGQEQNRAFNEVKRLLMRSDVLVHYSESRPLVLTCDASARGVGAVLAQPDTSGAERAVAYASRALTSAETNYSQIHKEALAIVFAVKKFHQYLYGRHFVLRTDHKPLVSIFGPGLGVPNMTASRLQRWALLLAAYDFEIEYIRTDANTADALSRLIGSYKTSNVQNTEEVEPEQTYLHFASEALLLSYEDIKKETRKDPVLGRVLSYIKDGWPGEVAIRELKPYQNRRAELYAELDCVMWGHRLIVPSTCREKVLRELHDSHMGIVKTKSIARSYVWWPGIDEAIEMICRACRVCAEVGDAPPHHVPVPWPWPARPWTRLHVDFLGPILGVKYLVVVDACSKWIEICKMKSTTAGSVIIYFREICARFGIPRQIVSDNGPPFSSEEFNKFLQDNGVEHLYSAPYKPSSNGAAENAVKICKRVIKKAITQKCNVDEALQRYLLMYRNTAHSTTGQSPAQLLQGRSLSTRLDRLKPLREDKIITVQRRQQEVAGGVQRCFQEGDLVWFRTYQGSRRWVEGVIAQRLGSTDYEIKSSEGKGIHRHVDQIKVRVTRVLAGNDPQRRGYPFVWPVGDSGSEQSVNVESGVNAASGEAGSGSRGAQMEREVWHTPGDSPTLPAPMAVERRYPTRERRPPHRLF